MARTLGGRAGGRATAAAATTTDKLSQPIQAPSPRRPRIKYPVRETPKLRQFTVRIKLKMPGTTVPMRAQAKKASTRSATFARMLK